MEQEILQIIESAKAKEKANHLSKKYQFFSTEEIIEELKQHSWTLVKQGEVKIRKTGKNYQSRIGKQRHILIFENPEFQIDNEGKINLCVRNSHDGGGCLELFFGFMRIVCANQIFSKSLGDGTSIKLRHSQNYKEEFKNLISTIIPLIEKYKKQLESLATKLLTDELIFHFANEAIKARFGNMSTVQSCLDVNKILVSKRLEDDGRSAWVIFNKVQEYLVQGGLTYETINKKGKIVERTTRKLRGINSLIAFNDYLYQLILTI